MKKLRVYFSGSIKGGRDMVETYAEIVDVLTVRCDVLIEHVADADYGKLGFAPPDMVYKRDTSLIQDSDVVIAEVTVPSLGVGYELAYAEHREIPVYCLYDQAAEKKISSMILGDPTFFKVPYNRENLRAIVEKIVDNLTEKLNA